MVQKRVQRTTSILRNCANAYPRSSQRVRSSASFYGVVYRMKANRTPSKPRAKATAPEVQPVTNEDDGILEGWEAREILRICDKSISGFARFCNCSRRTISGPKVLGAKKYVRLQWVRALRIYVSEEDYQTALRIVRTDKKTFMPNGGVAR